MRKVLLYSMLSALILVSCENFKNYRLDGMWQLKTVEDVDGNINSIDTVFYGFQRECVFSYTSVPSLQFYPYYGYIDMPSDNIIHITMDRRWLHGGNLDKFLNYADWGNADENGRITFNIMKYDKSNLILSNSGNKKTFTFKKF